MEQANPKKRTHKLRSTLLIVLAAAVSLAMAGIVRCAAFMDAAAAYIGQPDTMVAAGFSAAGFAAALLTDDLMNRIRVYRVISLTRTPQRHIIMPVPAVMLSMRNICAASLRRFWMPAVPGSPNQT